VSDAPQNVRSAYPLRSKRVLGGPIDDVSVGDRAVLRAQRVRDRVALAYARLALYSRSTWSSIRSSLQQRGSRVGVAVCSGPTVDVGIPANVATVDSVQSPAGSLKVKGW